jgi:hypothetical protein
VVAAALVVAALEAEVLVEGDLQGKARRGAGSEAGAGPGPPWAGSLPGPRSQVPGPRSGSPGRAPAALTFPMADGGGCAVECGPQRAVYIAGGLLRWQEQHKGARGGRSAPPSLFSIE